MEKECNSTQIINTNKKKKYFITAALYLCNIGFGVSATFLAPLLVDFCKAFQTDMQTMSVVLTVCRVTILVSALAFGVIFNYVNRHLVTAILVLVMGLTGMAFPHTPNLIYFALVYALQSICAGGHLTAQVVWVIEMWKESAGPYIQAQHFFFAFGCIFPPLIFAPYLNSATSIINATAANNSPLKNVPKMLNASHLLTTFLPEIYDVTVETNRLERFYIPCAICGGIIISGGIFLFFNYCAFHSKSSERNKNSEPEMSSTDGASTENNNDEENLEPNSHKSVFKKIFLIVVSTLLIGAVESMEAMTMSFLPVFGHYSDLKLSEADGAQLLSAYSIAYTVSRLAGVLIILKLHARWILCGNIAVVAVANAVLLFWAPNNLTFMYVGSVLLGVGFSTSIPSVFAYVQHHLEVTNVVGSILMVAGGFISGIFPVVLGTYIEQMPWILMYLNLGCVAICFCCLVSIVILMRNVSGKL